MPIKLQERPIFITGSERSGTTLIMAILGMHPRIAVPEVTWYYPRFRPWLFTYGDLAEPEHFRCLAHEMAYGLRVPFWNLPVDPRSFGEEMVARACAHEQSFAGVFAAMLERYAEHAAKPRWGEKTPYNLFYVEQILEDFPNAQFVFIHRDGRDVCAEFLDASFGPTNIYSAATLWHMGQQAVRPWREKLAPGQWYDVRYEDFVRAPEAGLRALCDYLGEEYDAALLDFHTTPIARKRGQSKDNAALGHPISERYVGRYRNELSRRDQGVMAWVAGESLRELGYTDIVEPVALTSAEVALYEELDGRHRAATLTAPGGWIVFESYNDWLIDNRERRRRAGIWSDVPQPAPFPVGTAYEETLSGMRAHRQWKRQFCIKREYSSDRALL